MGDVQLNLAALIGSRICHDLISPIGAINNGLELLTMSGAQDGPEMDLIGESVGNASARIRFFRIAFGAAGDQMVGRPEIVSILRDLYENSRLSVDWSPDAPQPRAAVRLAFLAILCIETALPYGGRVSITEDGGDWTLKGSADKLNINPDLWSSLRAAAPAQNLQPAQVQFALLPLVAADTARHIRVSSSDTEIAIGF